MRFEWVLIIERNKIDNEKKTYSNNLRSKN